MKSEKKLLSTAQVTVRQGFAVMSALMLMFLLMTGTGCQKSSMNSPSATADQRDAGAPGNRNNFTQVNLVSDDASFNPAHIDPNLVNAWGIAFSGSGTPWISSNEKGLTTIYDANGNTVIPPVNIPFHGDLNGSNPTGDVFNNTADFVIPSTGQVSKFIFATENGTIAAWNSGDTTVTVVDRSSDDAVYKGIAISSSASGSFLYATDFHNARVDMFDANFNYMSKQKFIDPDIPAGFAPFNIRNIGGQLYVTYAKQLPPDNHDDEAGPGNGYVDIYSLKGDLISRFASQGVLNSPWGITRVPNQDLIFVSNFGDGRINAFDTNGNFKNALNGSNGQPLVIEGIWAIAFPQNVSGSEKNRIYFTAGPNEESHGIYGYLTNQQ